MYVNVIDSYRYVVAICDKELLGKRFEQGKFQLDVKENFYKGEEKSKEEVEKIITSMQAEDATFNIIGKKSVQTAIKSGLISSENVGTIANIPFTLILL